MKFHWLTTTAAVAVLGSGVVLAQAQEPQKQHGNMGSRAEQGAARQPSAEQGRHEEQRAEQKAPGGTAHENASRATENQQHSQDRAKQQAQQRDQEHHQNQAREQNREHGQNAQQHKQQAQEHGSREEHRKGMAQRPSSLTSEQGNNEKKGESKASQRASGERSKHPNQATQNRKSEQSKQDAAQNEKTQKQNEKTQNQKSSSSRTNAQNAPTNRNANQANQAQQDSKTQQRAAQGKNQTTTSQSSSTSNTASAKLSQNDRSKVISTLKTQSRGSRESVNVRLSIGERLPPRIHVRPLPRTIVDIMPEYRGYQYVMVDDRVDIIDPHTHKVVDIVEEGGPSFAGGGSRFESGRVRLTSEQRQLLFRDARPMTSSQVSSSGGTCLTEQPVPDSLAKENPDLRGFNFLKIGNDIVLVDPKDNKVVDVIQQ